MSWNWQQPDWPNFTWAPARLRHAEEHFLLASGLLAGLLRHLSQSDQDQLALDVMTTEAVTTAEIEGEILDRSSVQSSVRKLIGLPSAKIKSSPAERGVAELMVCLSRSIGEPLSNETLFAWHRMLFDGAGLVDIGRYRTSPQPMQVVSGPIHRPVIHFEAPPHSKVPQEMAAFLKWFNHTTPSGTRRRATPLPALTRAGIAHLYFESIHPFEDGNGRLGRAVAGKALAQSLGRPTWIALAATILARRKSYYSALAASNQHNEITEWLAWFAGIVIEAQRRTTANLEFVIEKTKLLDRLRGAINSRQERALQRMLREGPGGFKGGLSAGNYMTVTGASPATATRDLLTLVELAALTRTGERRHARYHLAIPLQRIPAVTIDRDGNLHPASA